MPNRQEAKIKFFSFWSIMSSFLILCNYSISLKKSFFRSHLSFSQFFLQTLHLPHIFRQILDCINPSLLFYLWIVQQMNLILDFQLYYSLYLESTKITLVNLWELDINSWNWWGIVTNKKFLRAYQEINS